MNIPEKHIQKILMFAALAFIGLILFSVQKCSAQLDITKRSVTVTENFYKNGDSVYTASELRQEISDSLSDFYIDVGTRISDTAISVRGYTNQEINNLYDTLPFFSGEYDSLLNKPYLKDTIYQYEQDSSLARLSDTINLLATKADLIISESSATTIYVETTGDDDTGDGTTTETAYASIKRALDDIHYISSGITVTIQLGLGSFNMSQSDVEKLARTEGSGILLIKGTLDTLVTNLSLSHTDPDFYVQDALVNGLDPSWTPNELVGYYLYNPNIVVKYYYINSNTSNTLESGYAHYNASQLSGINNIVSFGSTITMTFSSGSEYEFNFDLSSLYFEALNLDIDSWFNFNGKYINLNGVEWQSGRLYTSGNTEIEMRGCYAAQRIYHYSLNPYSLYSNTIFNTYFYLYGQSRLNRDIFKGTLGLVLNRNSNWIIDLVDEYSKFKSANYPIYVLENNCRITNTIDAAIINLEAGINLITISGSAELSNININLQSDDIVGTPSSDWVSPALSYYVKPELNFSVYVKGYIFPEQELGLEESLTNATQNDITVGDINQNSSIIIDYEIQRSTLFEEGQIRILYDGTNLTYLQAHVQDNNSGAGIGVTFNVDFDAVDTDLINLEVTLDAGNNGTIKYDAKRKIQ